MNASDPKTIEVTAETSGEPQTDSTTVLPSHRGVACERAGDSNSVAACEQSVAEDIRHRIVAKEAEAVGVDHQRQAVPEKQATEMLEVIPCGVGGDKDRD